MPPRRASKKESLSSSEDSSAETSSGTGSSEESDDAEEQVLLQVSCGGRTKAMIVDASYSFLELKAKIESSFTCVVDALSAVDEDGDVMTIRNDAALSAAFEAHNNGDEDKLRIKVVAAGGARVSPQVTRSGAAAVSDQLAGTLVDPSLFMFGLTEQMGMATLVDTDLFADPSGGGGGGGGGMVTSLETPADDDDVADTTPDAAVRWEKVSELGRGTSGTVYKAKNLSRPGRFLAVKEFIDEDDHVSRQSRKEIAATRREIELMRSLRHDNIVDYIGTQRRGNGLVILMEYVDGGSLDGLVRERGALPEATVQRYAVQLLAGLAYLHENRVIHRDLKGGNVLVTADGKTLKLADFGCSRRLVDQQTAQAGCMTVTGSPLYMAPEIITGKGHGRRSDVWSLGCTLVEMATGRPPWAELAAGNEMFAIMHKIASSNSAPTRPTGVSADAIDFMKQCFIRDTARRPTTAELGRHPWIRKAPGA
jgi:hypothetical protein